MITIDKFGRINEAIYFIGLHSNFNLNKLDTKNTLNFLRYENIISLNTDIITEEFIKTFNDTLDFIKRHIVIEDKRLRKFMMGLKESMCYTAENCKVDGSARNNAFTNMVIDTAKSINISYNEQDMESKLAKSLGELNNKQEAEAKNIEKEEIKSVNKQADVVKVKNEKEQNKFDIVDYLSKIDINTDSLVRMAFDKMLKSGEEFVNIQFIYNDKLNSNYTNSEVEIKQIVYDLMTSTNKIDLVYIKDNENNLTVVGNTKSGMLCGYIHNKKLDSLCSINNINDIKSETVRKFFSFYYDRIFTLSKESGIDVNNILAFKEMQGKTNMNINNKRVVVVRGYDGVNELYIVDKSGNNIVGKIANSKYTELNLDDEEMTTIDRMMCEEHAAFMNDGEYTRNQLISDDSIELYEIHKDRLEQIEDNRDWSNVVYSKIIPRRGIVLELNYKEITLKASVNIDGTINVTEFSHGEIKVYKNLYTLNCNILKLLKLYTKEEYNKLLSNYKITNVGYSITQLYREKIISEDK